MEALCHRSVLRGHEAGGLRACKPQRVDELIDIEIEQLTHRSRRPEGARQSARMETAVESIRADGISNSGTQLVANNRRQNDLLAGVWSETFGRGKHGWNNTGAVVRHRLIVTVIELVALSRRAVDQRDTERVGTKLHAPGACALLLTELGHNARDRFRPRRWCAEDTASKAVENALLGECDDFRRQILIAKTYRELRDSAGRRGDFYGHIHR